MIFLLKLIEQIEHFCCKPYTATLLAVLLLFYYCSIPVLFCSIVSQPLAVHGFEGVPSLFQPIAETLSRQFTVTAYQRGCNRGGWLAVERGGFSRFTVTI